jgi:DNA polymerase III subunit delta'
MQFSKIAGQAIPKEILIRSVAENHVGHCLLFAGPEGAGNLPLAVAFANYVFCENKAFNDACGVCLACKKTSKLEHPDLHLAFPIVLSKDNETSDAFIAEWRAAFLEQPYLTLEVWQKKIGADTKQPIIGKEQANEIIKKLNIKAYEGSFKIMILWLPELMNTAASNKLLKIIEEPPPKTLFFLVSNHPEGLLPTIVSRSQLIKVKRLHEEEIVSSLVSNFQLDQSQALNIAINSDGNYSEAIQLINQKDVESDFESFREMMRICFKGDVVNVIGWAESFSANGREKLKGFLNYGLYLFRLCLIVNTRGASFVKINGEELEFVTKFAPFVTEKNILSLTEFFNKSIYHLERNANAKILMVDMVYKVLMLLNKK